MEKSRRTVAFIPVRGGSKSIPKKNIKPIAGKPLVYWVIDAALESNMFDDIYISTDDNEIASVVKQHSLSYKLTMVKREAETASDTATTESAMLEFSKKYSFDVITLLQATSPLTTGQDIKKAVSLFIENTVCTGLLSVCRQERFRWQKQPDGFYQPENYSISNRPRRQDFEGFLVENGAIYITNRESLMKTRNRISGNILCYEMPSLTYYELDEPSDWPIIEKLLEWYKKRESLSMPKNVKLFISDVDGVLTDAGMYYSENGDELKKFNTRDGKGFDLLRKAGIKVGIITSEDTKIVADRAKKLKIDLLHQGVREKGFLLKKILTEMNISPKDTVYIGDDINDLPVLKAVGFSACPADAVQNVQKVVNYICQKKGGEGCVREVADMLIQNIST